MKNKIADNLQRIQSNIADACCRVNRDRRDVRIIAVTKTVEMDTIYASLRLGLVELGESRVVELLQRQAAVKEYLSHSQNLTHSDNLEAPSAVGPDDDTLSWTVPHWHMVGHLQRNKVKPLLPVVDMIHSVDSLRLAEEINTAAARLGLEQKVKILLQVNTSKEKQKFGLAVGALMPLAEQINTLPNLQIVGLMTMAPLLSGAGEYLEDSELPSCGSGKPPDPRFCFARLRELFEEIRGEKIVGSQFEHLSMGMSQDYIAAVEEGATLLRIGSALFE